MKNPIEMIGMIIEKFSFREKIMTALAVAILITLMLGSGVLGKTPEYQLTVKITVTDGEKTLTENLGWQIMVDGRQPDKNSDQEPRLQSGSQTFILRSMVVSEGTHEVSVTVIDTITGKRTTTTDTLDSRYDNNLTLLVRPPKKE